MLIDDIIEYCKKRKYIMPSIWHAMGWINTEIAEVYELLLDREASWVRNNPESKPKFSKEELAEELGDIIFMVMLAGYSEGVNPLEAMKTKMDRKLNENVSNIRGDVTLLTYEQLLQEFGGSTTLEDFLEDEEDKLEERNRNGN